MKKFILKKTAFDSISNQSIPAKEDLVLSFKEIKELAKKINKKFKQSENLNKIAHKLGYKNFQHLRQEYVNECFEELGKEISRINATYIEDKNPKIINYLKEPFSKYLHYLPLDDATFIHDKIEDHMEMNRSDISILKFQSSFGDAEIKISKKQDKTFLKINFFDAIFIKKNSLNYGEKLDYLIQMFSIFIRTVEYDSFELFIQDIEGQLEKQLNE